MAVIVAMTIAAAPRRKIARLIISLLLFGTLCCNCNEGPQLTRVPSADVEGVVIDLGTEYASDTFMLHLQTIIRIDCNSKLLLRRGEGIIIREENGHSYCTANSGRGARGEGRGLPFMYYFMLCLYNAVCLIFAVSVNKGIS